MQHTNLFIRHADVSDASAIMALTQRAMNVYAQKSGITSKLDSMQETLDQIKFHIKHDYVLLAETRDMVVVGTVRLVLPHKNNGKYDTDSAYFSRFSVLPELQNTGVGRILYQAAENYFLATGIKRIRLHTAINNFELTSFYQARGFKLISTDSSRGYNRGCYEKMLI